MSITTLLVFLVVLGFVVGHLVTRYLSRYVWLAGAEYQLVGALLGPAFSPPHSHPRDLGPAGTEK